MIPSLKALERAFPGKGEELRALLSRERKTRDYKSVRDWCARCYHEPRYQERLECAVNEVLEGFGAEAIGDCADHHYQYPDAVYINMGDTYTTTLLYDYQRAKWIITSWGDWIELQERRGVRYD